jgi:flagella basal body P-ring formation protein FlgA
MKEIVALAEKYRKQRTASQLATLEYLRTRLSKLQVQARKIAEEEAAEKFQKVKRTALEMAHPWGFMCDLGLNMSDRSLEAADRVGLLDMHKTDYGRSFLANPLAIEAMRFR